MVQNKLGESKPLSFPPYRRSHFRSQTYLTLVRFFSRFPSTVDNDDGRMEQEKLENGSELSESVGSSSSMDPKDPIPKKIIQEARDTIEGFGDKDNESDTNEVELMDFQVDHIKFQHYDVNISRNANDLQVQREFTTAKEGEHEKEEQYCPNVPANYARNKVLHIRSWEEDAIEDHGNLLASKLSAIEDSPSLSKVCGPKMKSPLLSGNTSFNVPPNSHDISIQQNHLTNSTGNHSLINLEPKATDIVQNQLTKAPKGIMFINIGKSSLSSPSNPKQHMITPLNKKKRVQIRTSADQRASGAPKGVSFLSFLEYGK